MSPVVLMPLSLETHLSCLYITMPRSFNTRNSRQEQFSKPSSLELRSHMQGIFIHVAGNMKLSEKDSIRKEMRGSTVRSAST